MLSKMIFAIQGTIFKFYPLVGKDYFENTSIIEGILKDLWPGKKHILSRKKGTCTWKKNINLSTSKGANQLWSPNCSHSLLVLYHFTVTFFSLHEFTCPPIAGGVVYSSLAIIVKIRLAKVAVTWVHFTVLAGALNFLKNFGLVAVDGILCQDTN